MSEMTITRSDEGSKARYEARIQGAAGVGELTLSKMSGNMIIVDHTGVPDTLRGKGVAAALAQRVIDDSRAAGVKIVPLCPFFKAYAVKHRDSVADVVQI